MLEFPIKLHVMLLSWHEAFFTTLFEALFLIIQKYIINQYVIIIVFIFLIAMIHTLKRGLKSNLFCLATFSFLLSVKKQYSVIISLGFRQHLNLSLSPCFISLLFWSSQIVVSNRIFITSNQRFVKWHNHKIYELICCNIWERADWFAQW